VSRVGWMTPFGDEISPQGHVRGWPPAPVQPSTARVGDDILGTSHPGARFLIRARPARRALCLPENYASLAPQWPSKEKSKKR
jgi:hypothetical protein